MWTTIALFVAGYFIYVLWNKVKALHSYLEASKEITKFRIAPKGEFWNLPMVREAAGLDEDEWYKPNDKLTEKARAKIGKFAREHQKTFYQLYTFFPDRELLFSSNEWGAGFVNFPYGSTFNKTETLFSKELLTTKDDYEIQFIITIRWVKDALPNMNVPVYVGYLKKIKDV